MSSHQNHTDNGRKFLISSSFGPESEKLWVFKKFFEKTFASLAKQFAGLQNV